MTQLTDINDMKVTMAEQVVVLRETKHLVANLAMKFDALSEKVIILGGLAGEVAKGAEAHAALDRRVVILEQWKAKQEGALGLADWCMKVVPWAALGAAGALTAKLLGAF